MKRILFVAEAVTLSQIVRLAQLARSLDPSQFEVHFASAQFPEIVFQGSFFHRHALYSLSPEAVERKLARGGRLYSSRILRRYVADDLHIIDKVKPDLIIGDLRWSLLVSAPLRGIPLMALINAYWSPDAQRREFPMPDHPIVRLLGVRRATPYFAQALPYVFRYFASPLNGLRREHGLPIIGSLQELLTSGDAVVFPDVPQLIPIAPLAPHHHYLGPILWSPHIPLPPWWNELREDRPSIYVTLGSSGYQPTLLRVLDALSTLPVEVMVSTAGRTVPKKFPANVHFATYLPGALAARRSALVICNGGSSTGYQALAEGRPVVGLPWNLDQYLAMTAIEEAGAGATLRSTTATTAEIREKVVECLEGRHTKAALYLAETFSHFDSGARFRSTVDQLLSESSAAKSEKR